MCTICWKFYYLTKKFFKIWMQFNQQIWSVCTTIFSIITYMYIYSAQFLYLSLCITLTPRPSAHGCSGLTSLCLGHKQWQRASSSQAMNFSSVWMRGFEVKSKWGRFSKTPYFSFVITCNCWFAIFLLPPQFFVGMQMHRCSPYSQLRIVRGWGVSVLSRRDQVSNLLLFFFGGGGLCMTSAQFIGMADSHKYTLIRLHLQWVWTVVPVAS